jgi:DNA polymerase-3 subunit beta
MTSQPAKVADVDGAALAKALRTVAGTAARDDSLPLFTGVRLYIANGRLNLVASDRYRMAVAKLPLLASEGPLDALVPAAMLVEIGKRAKGVVGLHTAHNRFGLSWAGSTVSSAVLDGGFLSESTIKTSTVDTTVEVEAHLLASAVRRVGVFAESRRVLTLEVGDTQLRSRVPSRTPARPRSASRRTCWAVEPRRRSRRDTCSTRSSRSRIAKSAWRSSLGCARPSSMRWIPRRSS